MLRSLLIKIFMQLHTFCSLHVLRRKFSTIQSPEVIVIDYYETADLYKSCFIKMRKHYYTLSNVTFSVPTHKYVTLAVSSNSLICLYKYINLLQTEEVFPVLEMFPQTN